MPFEDFLSYVKFEKRYSNHTLASYETDLNQFASQNEFSLDLVDEAKTLQAHFSRVNLLKNISKFLAPNVVTEQLTRIFSGNADERTQKKFQNANGWNGLDVFPPISRELGDLNA